MNVVPDADSERARQGKKCVLLRLEVRPGKQVATNGEVPTTNGIHGDHQGEDTSAREMPWLPSKTVTELVEQDLISVIPYNLDLGYNYWSYYEIISSILPLEASSEIPSSFAQVGHVAHLNLREAYLPYKSLIAEILLDKNPACKDCNQQSRRCG